MSQNSNQPTARQPPNPKERTSATLQDLLHREGLAKAQALSEETRQYSARARISSKPCSSSHRVWIPATKTWDQIVPAETSCPLPSEAAQNHRLHSRVVSLWQEIYDSQINVGSEYRNLKKSAHFLVPLKHPSNNQNK